MKEFNFTGNISEDGILHVIHRQTFDNNLKQLGKCFVHGKIEQQRIILSSKQRGYYFGYIIPTMVKQMREKAMDMQVPKEFEWLQWFYLSVTTESLPIHLKEWFIDDIEVDQDTGEIEKVKKSIARMSKEKFGEFLEKVIQFCAEKLQLVILPPNTQTDINLDFERTEKV